MEKERQVFLSRMGRMRERNPSLSAREWMHVAMLVLRPQQQQHQQQQQQQQQPSFATYIVQNRDLLETTQFLVHAPLPFAAWVAKNAKKFRPQCFLVCGTFAAFVADNSWLNLANYISTAKRKLLTSKNPHVIFSWDLNGALNRANWDYKHWIWPFCYSSSSWRITSALELE